MFRACGSRVKRLSYALCREKGVNKPDILIYVYLLTTLMSYCTMEQDTFDNQEAIMKIGYIRVSREAQTLALQEDAMKKAQVDKVYHEKVSGVKVDRPELK